MSRTWKDRPYRVMEEEAAYAGCLRMRRWPLSREDPWKPVPDVIDYAYAAGRNVHIPARRFTLCRFVERSWTTDYGADHRVREALREAATRHNNGFDMRDWDDPVAYQRRRRWIDES